MVATIVPKVDRRFFIVLLVLCLISTTALLPPLPQAEGGKVQPILRQMAASQPETVVGVIVQKAGSGQSPEELVRRLGGEVTKDLRIINAFAAELPAGEVERLARDPGVRWISFDAPVIRQGDPTTFITWATAPGISLANQFTEAAHIYGSYQGPNETYGYGRWRSGENEASFTGFSIPDLSGSIEKVEAVLYLYLSAPLKNDRVRLLGYLDGAPSKAVVLRKGLLNRYVGQENAGHLFVDLTSVRDWSWEDFNRGLELQIRHRKGGAADGALIYYDAVGYRITFRADEKPHKPLDGSIDLSNLANSYNYAVGATELWNSDQRLQGQGVTVAVVDSGIRARFGSGGSDFNYQSSRRSRVLRRVNFSSASQKAGDEYGHGTHVAGIIGGNGTLSDGTYIGVAPKVNLLNIKVSDAYGSGHESDVVAGLQWVYEHRDRFNIRVVNISLNSSVPQSYHTSPLDAAVEILWFNRIVVVVSAGNNAVGHNGILYPPANDPFVISVGAVDDMGTFEVVDDRLATFSACGDAGGFFKPDLVAPGCNIISLTSSRNATLIKEHPDHRVDMFYFRMSGTSMSSAVTAGAVALLLQAEPDLNPDQVKYRLLSTARFPDDLEGGAGYLDIYRAVHTHTTDTANTGQEVSQLLWTGPEPPIWDSVQWDSVHWDSVHWDSVHWDSVHWDNVHWDNVYWGDPVYSSSISWD